MICCNIYPPSTKYKSIKQIFIIVPSTSKKKRQSTPQVLAENPAKASDDFYALGKVIYCALTGLAVNEYPGVPADMTISIDANLNKALRESCSQPINSTAEFRKLLAGKHLTPSPQKTKDKRQAAAETNTFRRDDCSLAGTFVYLFYQPKKMEAKHIPKSVQFDPEVEKSGSGSRM